MSIDLNKRVAALKAAAQAARINAPIEEPVTLEPAPESDGLMSCVGGTRKEIHAHIEAAIDMARPENSHRYPGQEGVDFHGTSYVHRGFGGRRRHKRRQP